MKPGYLLFTLALSGLLPERALAQALPQRLEQLARTNSHFSVTVMVHHRALRIEPLAEERKYQTNGTQIRFLPATNALAAEQLRLRNELRALSGNREALKRWLSHPDPRVRTLALGAIFQREDGRDLPLIATRIGDSAETFRALHDSFNSIGGPQPLSVYEDPQTVGEIVDEMLAFWGVPRTGAPAGTNQAGFGSLRSGVTKNDFAGYWKKYEHRDHSASWFAVQMKRATRQTTPIQPEYRPDIDRVLKAMDSLPMPDRAWTKLYVLAPEQGGYEPPTESRIVSSEELVTVAKKLGTAALLQFLQRRKISNDPDLLMDEQSDEFVAVSNFILLHADKLFRPQDAEALLTCGYVLRSSGKIAPAWWIGASLVQPARASEILRQAVDDETRQSEAKNSYVQGTGMMAGYLWRIRGPAEKDFLVEWFYSSLFVKSSPLPQQEEFFRVVNLAARPETKQLLAALVRDRRFELTDWEVLREMLETVNAARKTPLVAKTEIYDAQPGSRPDQKLVLDRWRNLLRREFGFAAVPSPNESPPKKVLTAPAYSILLTNPARRIILSRNGRWLATVNEGDNRGEVQVRDADSGQLVWNFPASRLSLIAFEDSGHLLQLENGLHEWDVEKRAEVRTAKLTGGPVSGAWGESPAFDSAGVRLGFAGYQDIVCFDTASGRALWICHADSGVGAASALSRDGSLLAVGGGSDTARVVGAFDAANGKLLRRFDNHSGKVWALTFSPDNHSLITVTSENGARRWDVATGELQGEYSYPVEFIGAGLPIWQPVFSPDGRRLAIAGAFTKANTFRIGIFDVATGEMEWEVRRTAKAGNDGPPFGLAFSPDGQTLYSCGRRIEAWPLK